MLLTSAEDLVKWWKEHFEDLLNPIVTPSIIKAESGEEGDDSPITDVVTAQWQGPWVGLGTLDQFFILSRIFEGVWEFVQQVYMCFCGPGQVIWLGPSGYNGGSCFDRLIGAASAIMWMLNWYVILKRELSIKTKLSKYQSVYVPVITYGHELWVSLQIQAAEINFLRRVAGVSA